MPRGLQSNAQGDKMSQKRSTEEEEEGATADSIWIFPRKLATI